MEPLSLMPKEVSLLLGPDPRQLDLLISEIFSSKQLMQMGSRSSTYSSAWARMQGCVRAYPNELMHRLASMVGMSRYNVESTLVVFGDVLKYENFKIWDVVDIHTKMYIKEILFGAIAQTAQDESDYTRPQALSQLLGELSCNGNPQDWLDLYQFVRDCTFDISNSLRISGLILLTFAPRVVIQKLTSDNTYELQGLMDRMAYLLGSNTISLTMNLALQAMVSLWNALSPLKAIVFQEYVELMFRSFSMAANSNEEKLYEMLLKVQHPISFCDFSRKGDGEVVLESLAKLVESNLKFNTKRRAINVMFQVSGILPKPLSTMILPHFMRRLLQNILSLMSQIEREERGGGNRDTAHIFEFGRDSCKIISSLIGGVPDSIEVLAEVIDIFIGQNAACTRSALAAIGPLSRGLSHGMEWAQYKVMQWIMASLNSSDSQVLSATCDTILTVAPGLKGCPHVNELLEHLSHKALNTVNQPQLKHHLKEARSKVMRVQSE